jgi:hypothetical protein
LEVELDLETGPVAREDSVVERAVLLVQLAASQSKVTAAAAAGWEEGYSWKAGVWKYRDAVFRTILPQAAVAVGATALEGTAEADSAVVFSATEALSRCVNAPRLATTRMGERVAPFISEGGAVKAVEAEFFF